MVLLRGRLIASGRLLTGSTRLRGSLRERLILISNALWKLAAIGVSGTVITCRLEGSGRALMLVSGAVLVKRWLAEARDVVWLRSNQNIFKTGGEDGAKEATQGEKARTEVHSLRKSLYPVYF